MNSDYEFWELLFSNEGALWKFEPSDSAFMALELFKSKNVTELLIPGIGYGRNAKLFCDHGIKVTGIEISGSAIEIAKKSGLNCKIHHGSVTAMPFDAKKYDAIYCYALIHLLNRHERRVFLRSCYNQLKHGGLMIFTVASVKMESYGEGKYISHNRYLLNNGLKVYFYDEGSVHTEFSDFGLVSFNCLEEPVKFMDGQNPLQMFYIVCEK